MLGKKWIFNSLNLTDLAHTEIVLTNVSKPIPLRTQVYEKSNFHWAYSSPTLAWWRLFTFRWSVFADSKPARWTGWKKIIDVIQPEFNPNASNRWFYDLTRETDWGIEVTVKAKVYRAPEPINGLDDAIIEFSFDLYAETEKVCSTTTKTATWNTWFFIGNALENTLSNTLSWYVWYIECENAGNRPAPVKIEVEWSAQNPKIINITNWNKYKIGNSSSSYTTTSLVYDNRNEDNDPTKQLVVTDLWNSIKSKRTQWWDIFLIPWTNQVVVLIDNYPGDWSFPNVTITWCDTYFLP